LSVLGSGWSGRGGV